MVYLRLMWKKKEKKKHIFYPCFWVAGNVLLISQLNGSIFRVLTQIFSSILYFVIFV